MSTLGEYVEYRAQEKIRQAESKLLSVQKELSDSERREKEKDRELEVLRRRNSELEALLAAHGISG